MSGATAAGMRRRPTSFFGLALLVAGAVGITTASPLLLRWTQQQSLATATPTSTLAAVITYDPFSPPDESLGQHVLAPESLWQAAPGVTTLAQTYSWTPVGGTASRSAASVEAHLLSSPRCAGVRFAAGRCPGDGEVAVSTTAGVPLGSQIRLEGVAAASLHVVGLYAPRDGEPYADPVMSAVLDRLASDRANDLIVDSGTIAGVTALSTVTDRTWVTVVGVAPAQPLRLEDLTEVHRSLADARDVLHRQGSASFTTPIDQILAVQQKAAEGATVIAIGVAVQILTVAWAVQALLVAEIARARAREWGITRLRGFRLSRRLRAIVAEPVLSVLVGAIAGVVLAGSVTLLPSVGGAEQLVQPLPLLLGALAVAGSVLVLAVASVRSATVPLTHLLRERAEPVRLSRLALVAQAGVVIATVLVVFSVATGGRVTGSQLPLLAPTLIALTAGLLALRIAVPVLRRRLRRRPRSLTGLLVGRRFVRTPALLASAIVLSTAVALATAALQTALISDRLQQQRAEAGVGAARVLQVRMRPGQDLIAAVHRADPRGRTAMAAIDLTDGSGPERVVAVDMQRFQAVSSWQQTWSGTDGARLRRLLAPATGPTIRLVGSRVELDLADTRTLLYPGEDPASDLPLSQLQLVLTVQTRTAFRSIPLGRLSSRRLVAALPCPTGCRVVDLAVRIVGEGEPWRVATRIVGLRTDGQSATTTAAVLNPRLWRQQQDANTVSVRTRVQFDRAHAGLGLRFTVGDPSSLAAIAPRDAPQPLPVLIGPQTRLAAIAGLRTGALGSDLGFGSVVVQAVHRARILPRAEGDGVLADLTTMQRITDPATVRGHAEVWLSAASSPRTVEALQRQGLQIIGEQRLGPVERADLSGAVPRVVTQGAVLSAAGLGLALLAVLVLLLMRRVETAATSRMLRAAGVPRRTIRRLAVAKTVLPAAVGAAIGAAAGTAASLLVAPVLPLAAGQGVVPPFPVAVLPVAVLAPAAICIAGSFVLAMVAHIRTGS